MLGSYTAPRRLSPYRSRTCVLRGPRRPTVGAAGRRRQLRRPVRDLLATALCIAAYLAALGCGRTDAGGAGAPEVGGVAAVAETGPAVVTRAADAPREAEVEGAGTEDWLVWFRRGDGFETRWLRTAGATFAVAAAREAVVVSDGERLWHLVRRDALDLVSTCACANGAERGECRIVGQLTRPGLTAIALDGGAETPIVAPAANGTAGEQDISVSLELAGGVGALLFYDAGESGYECGAHGVYETSAAVFDLARGEPRDPAYGDLAARLPESVRAPAVAELVAELARCDGEALAADEVARKMELRSVHLALDPAGAPTVAWGFTMPLPFVCAPDYAAHGAGDSGLLAKASELSLGGPPPAGLAAALADIGATPTVGLSRVTLAGAKRDAALARFRALPERSWPPDSFSVIPSGARRK